MYVAGLFKGASIFFQNFYMPVITTIDLKFMILSYNDTNINWIYYFVVEETVASSGECRSILSLLSGPCNPINVLTNVYRVCASNGVTYMNVEEARCLYPQNSGKLFIGVFTK